MSAIGIKWTRSGTVIFLMIITVLFTIFSALFPNTDVLIVVRSFQFSSSMAVVYSYISVLRKVWTDEFGSSEDLLTFAIVLGYAALGLNAFWLLIWRGANEKAWMVDAAINGYCVLVSSWAAVIYSAAPGARKGVIRSEGKHLVLTILLATIVVSVFFLYATSTVKKMEEFLYPYMAEDPDKEFFSRPRKRDPP